MGNVFKVMTEFMPYIIISLAITIFLLFILVIILFKSLGNLEKKYRKMMRGVNSKNLEDLIQKYLDKVDEANSNSTKALEECIRIENHMKRCIQKVSVIRFKAFDDVGSDLSFSISLLDENNDGVILTGIYGRQESTTYAKPIDKGISRYDLSDEELTVLNQAISKN